MTKREAAIVSAYTGYLVGEFAVLQHYVEEKLGRKVDLAEMGQGPVVLEIHDKSEPDFMQLKVED
jgi:hypothetical protein